MFLIEKRILSFKLISSLRYALKFKKWPNFNSPRDLNEKVIADQQKIADTFYDLKLIPKKLDIKSVVWLPEQKK
jgi:ABC-type nitrate/sulfonate/bicarbonate transport system substrate-binding protein